MNLTNLIFLLAGSGFLLCRIWHVDPELIIQEILAVRILVFDCTNFYTYKGERGIWHRVEDIVLEREAPGSWVPTLEGGLAASLKNCLDGKSIYLFILEISFPPLPKLG